jgi:membrane-bound lytic murein transglycosylase D
MQRLGALAVLILSFVWLQIPLLRSPGPALAAEPSEGRSPHFPRPPVLTANVEFWRQVYTDFGVGDFVLHDRDNLGVVYDVVRVPETGSQARAATLAREEVQRLRDRYAKLLTDLAGAPDPTPFGEEAAQVWRLWGCPCAPEVLTRAAGNIRVQQGLREKVEEGLARARKLMPKIVSILRKHDVPVELAALPLVESSFNPTAKSKAGAVGLWQFIRSTGKRYLTITKKRDDRQDPIRATEAAAKFLRHNYAALGSWPLAVMAYNHGPEGIQAAKTTVGSSDVDAIIRHYAGPRFGFASKNFYAEFLAAVEILHPEIRKHAPARDTAPGTARVSTES